MPDNARLLALDTSTECLCVALCDGDRTEVVEDVGGAQASVRILPAVQALLARAGWTLRDLDAVAIARGPGAFTGLRTACSVGQGLALGLGVPVLPLDSLRLVAQDAWRQLVRPAPTAPAPEAATVLVAMDARMGEAYAAAYRGVATGGEAAAVRWTPLRSPALWSPGPLSGAWRELASTVAPGGSSAPWVAAGSAWSVLTDLVAPPVVERVLPQAERSRALADVARQAWADGAAVDPALALPLYLRDRVALTTAERERAAQAPAPAGQGIG